MFTLDQFSLPFTPNALEPYISASTIEFHHGKHLATYIKNLNDLISGTEFENMPISDIVKKSSGKIFNNAAQVFNHDFFFKCIAPGGGKFPEKLGDREKFMTEFKAAATGLFGSGWVWLTSDGKIETTSNADTPIAHGRDVALTLDVWEHAYYLDYQNRRADFADTFLQHLVNWDFVATNLK